MPSAFFGMFVVLVAYFVSLFMSIFIPSSFVSSLFFFLLIVFAFWYSFKIGNDNQEGRDIRIKAIINCIVATPVLIAALLNKLDTLRALGGIVLFGGYELGARGVAIALDAIVLFFSVNSLMKRSPNRKMTRVVNYQYASMLWIIMSVAFYWFMKSPLYAMILGLNLPNLRDSGGFAIPLYYVIFPLVIGAIFSVISVGILILNREKTK